MRLTQYLKAKYLSHAAFGRLRPKRPVPRVTIRQWANGDRFPQDPVDLSWISKATEGAVTAEDFVGHALERAKQRAAARKARARKRAA